MIKNVTLESLINQKFDPKKKLPITIDQLKELIKVYSNYINTKPYTDEDIKCLEDSTKFTLGPITKEMLKTIGLIYVNGFTLPDCKMLINYNKAWKENVAKDDEKKRFIVIESDNGDYTLVDSNDKIAIYDHLKKNTRDDYQDVSTHIAKHIMAAITGVDY